MPFFLYFGNCRDVKRQGYQIEFDYDGKDDVFFTKEPRLYLNEIALFNRRKCQFILFKTT